MKIQIGTLCLQIMSLTNANHARWRTFCSKAKDNNAPIKGTKRYIIYISQSWTFLILFGFLGVFFVLFCFVLFCFLFCFVFLFFLLLAQKINEISFYCFKLHPDVPTRIFFLPNNTSDAGGPCQIAVSWKLPNSNTSTRQIKMIFFQSTKTTKLKKQSQITLLQKNWKIPKFDKLFAWFSNLEKKKRIVLKTNSLRYYKRYWIECL